MTRIRFFELTVVLRGKLEYTVNRKNIEVMPGDVLFLRHNVIRARKAFTDADYFSFNFFAEGNTVDLPVYMEKSATKEIQLLLSACDEIYKRSFDDNNTQRPLLILECILQQLNYNVHNSDGNSLVVKIKNYIRENLSEQLSLDKICKAVFFSTVYCSSVFKKETGKSIISYVIDEKIEEAKKLILEGVNLKQIAEKLGFSDYNYFSRLFKKRVKYSPSQYKNYPFLK